MASSQAVRNSARAPLSAPAWLSVERQWPPPAWRAWPPREEQQRSQVAPRPLADELRAALGAAGIGAGENATYTLHPASTGHRHATRWPGRVLCVEVRRDLLGDPWIPFEESPIGAEAAERLARPIAEAIDRALRRRGSGED